MWTSRLEDELLLVVDDRLRSSQLGLGSTEETETVSQCVGTVVGGARHWRARGRCAGAAAPCCLTRAGCRQGDGRRAVPGCVVCPWLGKTHNTDGEMADNTEAWNSNKQTEQMDRQV